MREQLERIVQERRDNAHKAGKEGPGTHRNCGDAGRVGALYMEAMRELEEWIAKEAKQ